jgi:hypothetical protein
MTVEADPAAPTRRNASIFQSYGWGDAADIAIRLKRSLEKAGYEVWIDSEQLRPDDENFWLALEGALNKCELVVALLSPHSVRLEGELATAHGASVCHYELMMAVRKEKGVLPVFVVECDTPLAIIRYEPLDFTRWRVSADAYDEGVAEILRAIQNIRTGDRRYVIYVDKLAPYDFFAELRTAAGGFVGRDWLIARIEAWLGSDRRCFLIEADPGSGKTAFVAEMVRRNQDGRILAYHFCNSLKPDTVDARMFVRYVAAMLCGTVSAYAQRLRHSENLVSALKSNDPTTMLSQGVLAALRVISMDRACYIMVDALDEAVTPTLGGGDGKMTIPRLLAQAIGDFPPWLKLVVTTRRDDRIIPLFQHAERCFLGDAAGAQRDDLRNYVERRFATPELRSVVGTADQNHIVATVVERSGANFQYADTVLAALRSGELGVGELGRLPQELGNLYYQFADRRFPDPGDFSDARIVCSVLLAAREPLTRTQLAVITGLTSDAALLPTLDALSCFLTWDTGSSDERVYRPAHKSISDWLLQPHAEFDKFKVDLAPGRDAILAHCRGWAAHHDPYALTHLIAHLLESGYTAEALAEIRQGFFVKRRSYVDPRLDHDDSRALTMALVENQDQRAILELSQTDDIWQRDGVAAALQLAPHSADGLIDHVVGALLTLSG